MYDSETMQFLWKRYCMILMLQCFRKSYGVMTLASMTHRCHHGRAPTCNTHSATQDLTTLADQYGSAQTADMYELSNDVTRGLAECYYAQQGCGYCCAKSSAFCICTALCALHAVQHGKSKLLNSLDPAARLSTHLTMTSAW